MKQLIYGKGKNPSDLLYENRALAVRLLMKNGPCSRSILAEQMGLTGASLSKIISNLLERGVVEEAPSEKGEKGRRSIPIKLRDAFCHVAAINISLTEISYSILDIHANILLPIKTQRFGKCDGFQGVQKLVTDSINEMLRADTAILTAGISMPALLISNFMELHQPQTVTERKRNSGNSFVISLPGLIRDIPICIGVDAKSAALAEWWFTPLNSEYLAFLYADMGLGAGFMSHGMLVHGEHPYTNEVGHMSINYNGRPCTCHPGSRGCAEQYCSVAAFLRDVARHLPHNPKSLLAGNKSPELPQILDAIYRDDEFAQNEVKNLSRYFGYCIINILRIYTPDTIIIGGALSQIGDKLLEGIQETLQSRMNAFFYENVTIQLSRFGDKIGVLGAGALAIDTVLQDPLKYA